MTAKAYTPTTDQIGRRTAPQGCQYSRQCWQTCSPVRSAIESAFHFRPLHRPMNGFSTHLKTHQTCRTVLRLPPAKHRSHILSKGQLHIVVIVAPRPNQSRLVWGFLSCFGVFKRADQRTRPPVNLDKSSRLKTRQRSKNPNEELSSFRGCIAHEVGKLAPQFVKLTRLRRRCGTGATRVGVTQSGGVVHAKSQHSVLVYCRKNTDALWRTSAHKPTLVRDPW